MSHNLIRIVFALTALVLGSAGAGAQFNIPSPDEVFRLSASKSADGGIILDWAIAPDMYLYRDKVIVSASPGDAKPIPVETSPGQKKDDPTFGTTEVYHDAARATVSASALAAAGSPQTVHVTYQGCAEKLGICYPPETKAIELATLPVAANQGARPRWRVTLGHVPTGASQPVEIAASAPAAPQQPRRTMPG